MDRKIIDRVIRKLILKIPTGLFILGLFFTACNVKDNLQKDSITEHSTFQNIKEPAGVIPKAVNELGKDIRYVLQDKNEKYWFATYGEGVYYLDGKNLFQFTDKDGLYSNFVSEIQEDTSGNLWSAEIKTLNSES